MNLDQSIYYRDLLAFFAIMISSSSLITYADPCEIAVKNFLELNGMSINDQSNDKKILKSSEIEKINEAISAKNREKEVYLHVTESEIFKEFKDPSSKFSRKKLEGFYMYLQKNYKKANTSYPEADLVSVAKYDVKKLNESISQILGNITLFNNPVNKLEYLPFTVKGNHDNYYKTQRIPGTDNVMFYKNKKMTPYYKIDQEKKPGGVVATINKDVLGNILSGQILPYNEEFVITPGTSFTTVAEGKNCYIDAPSVDSGLFSLKGIKLKSLNREKCESILEIWESKTKRVQVKNDELTALINSSNDFTLDDEVDSYETFESEFIEPYVNYCNRAINLLASQRNSGLVKNKIEKEELMKKCNDAKVISDLKPIVPAKKE